MKALLLFLLALLFIRGGLKLARQRTPILKYPPGGLLTHPQIQVVQPNLNLPR